MGIVELTILAVALAMDAFAVAICLGLNMKKATMKRSFIVAFYFGLFQAIMPLIGFLVASLFADYINAFAHFIAFSLLLLLGIKMIAGSLKKEETKLEEMSLKPKTMLPYAIATSIDALAVGVTFAFLKVDIIPAIALIGVITFAIAMLGVKLGGILGLKFKSKAELAGGIVLILIGLKILIENLWF